MLSNEEPGIGHLARVVHFRWLSGLYWGKPLELLCLVLDDMLLVVLALLHNLELVVLVLHCIRL